MRYTVLICLFYFMVFINTYDALGISSKLDLDGLQTPKIIGPNTHRSVLQKNVAKVQDLGVVCVSGEGCNSTKANQSTDSIETDVVVHVKTSVNSNESKKNVVVDDAPEVPVIIGTNDKKHGENVIVNSGIFTPIKSPVSTTNTPFYTYNTPSLQSGSLYAEKYDFLVPQRRTDQIPSVSIGTGNLRPNTYKPGVEVHLPRFEPSFHTHYFEENPPTQVVWYPKTPDHGYKSVVKPPSWSPGELGSTTHKHYPRPGVVCSCKNEVSRGLQWHPKRPTYETDPGRQINDKLAPLV